MTERNAPAAGCVENASRSEPVWRTSTQTSITKPFANTTDSGLGRRRSWRCRAASVLR
jgi:hypothetical protein